MARYSIEDTTLTALGDAVRSKVGETREAEVPLEQENPIHIYIDTEEYDITSLPLAGMHYELNQDINIPGATTYKIISSYDSSKGDFSSSGGILKYTSSTGATAYGCNLLTNAENTVDTSYGIKISISIYKSFYEMGKYFTLDFSIYAYDVDGNLITTQPATVPNTLTPLQMAEEINNLPPSIPEEALTISANTYAFGYNTWNWFLEKTKGKLKLTAPTGNSLFYQSTSLKEVPDFDIKVKRSGNTVPPVDILDNTFTGCSALTKMPNIYIGRDPSTQVVPWVVIKKMTPIKDFGDKQCIFFEDDTIIKGFAYDFFQGYRGDYPTWLFELTNIDWDYMHANSSAFGTLMPLSWYNAFYIRTIPILKDCYVTHTAGNYYTPWYSINLQNCYSLEEVILPRPGASAQTSNQLTSDFNYLHRLKSFTFDVQEDGTPYTANWKSQVIDLSNYVGWNPSASTMIQNTKFTEDTKITTEEQWHGYIDGTYPDGWSDSLEYSTFGKTAATELINTLPDTSAYGTNTVKFKANYASAIPGEKMSELPEEVIAVAAAKGWTVSFV